MRVCLVPHRYPPELGGVAVAAERYARCLAEAGHRVEVVCLDPKQLPGASERREDDGVGCTRVGTHRRSDEMLAAWFEHVVASHRAAPFDVVVGRYIGHAAFVAVMAARFLGLPSIVSARGNDLGRDAFDSGHFAQILWSLTHATAVTAVSRELARQIVALVPAATPEIVHNGVDTESFRPAHDAAREPSLVLFAGEARQKKGLPVLLEAHARLCRDPGAVTLVLAGGVRHDDSAMLEVFRRQHPSAEVSVLPALPRAELVAYYRRASVFVMPSLRDGLPNALLEAMACGCPVVATPVGGIPEVVRDGIEGLLVRPADADALAAAVRRLLADPAEAKSMGARARERVVDCFSVERERASDLALLDRVLCAGVS